MPAACGLPPGEPCRLPGLAQRAGARLGDRNAAVAVVGLAPGLRGANRMGRPFTGDHSGALLFGMLRRFGLTGDAAPCWRIVNAVRCVPPGNLPTAAEVAACNLSHHQQGTCSGHGGVAQWE